VNMFPGIILACVAFVVAVSLSCIMTFPFIVGFVLQMGSTPILGSIVPERCLFRQCPRLICLFGVFGGLYSRSDVSSLFLYCPAVAFVLPCGLLVGLQSYLRIVVVCGLAEPLPGLRLLLP
jgi:hypothetical protein